MLLPTCPSVTEKYIHRTSAEYENSGYGIPLLGIPASLPKKNEKMSMVKRGCSTAHVAPRAACLYRMITSRHARKYKISRARHNSEIHSRIGHLPGFHNSENAGPMPRTK